MPSQVLNENQSPDISPETLRSNTRTIQRRLLDSATINLRTGATDTKSTYKNLRNKSTEVQLRTLARISSEVSKALNIYQGFCNSGWDIVAESDRGQQILEDWFGEMSDRGINVNNLINENIYDLYILGAMCMRTILINDEPEFIRNIPPDRMSFIHQYDPDPQYLEYGKIWYTGFFTKDSTSEFVVMESIIDINPYFYYGTMLTDSTSPKGISIIESVTDLAISSGEKNYMMTEYLRGNIFPHEIISLILEDYFNALADENIEFRLEDSDTGSPGFNTIKENAVQAVRKYIDESDSTQTLVTDVPVEKIVIGTLEGNNLQGLSEINEAHEAEFPRALKVAQALLGARRQGSALNDTQSKYEIRSMYKNILNIRSTIRAGWQKLCSSYLEYRGESGKGGIEFSDTDVELKQSITEAINNEAKAGKTLVETRTFSRQEIREALTKGSLDLTQFPAEMPAEIADEIEESPDADTED